MAVKHIPVASQPKIIEILNTGQNTYHAYHRELLHEVKKVEEEVEAGKEGYTCRLAYISMWV